MDYPNDFLDSKGKLIRKEELSAKMFTLPENVKSSKWQEAKRLLELKRKNQEDQI
jgi:adenine-specific DNA methylase